ncbi:MAG: protein kinase, partial [Bacillota bacterium]|nr:protein kinase [Bacillota bacterium]
MADIPVFNSEKTVGNSYVEYKRGELVAFLAKVCDTAFSQRGQNGYRGGIRPGNISICDDGRVAIGSGEKPESEEGTKDALEYIAPEMFWNGSCSAAADVYAVGLMLYAGINGGRLPFVPKSSAKASPDQRAAAMRERMNGKEIKIPWGSGKKLTRIIEKALAFKVEDRYEDTAALGAALRGYLNEVPVDTSKTAKEAFDKDISELSPVEAMMIDIIHQSVLEDDLYSEAPEAEETPVEEAPDEEEAP